MGSQVKSLFGSNLLGLSDEPLGFCGVPNEEDLHNMLLLPIRVIL